MKKYWIGLAIITLISFSLNASNGNVTFIPQTFNASTAGEYYLTKWSGLNNSGLSVSIQNNTGTDTVNCGGSVQLQAVVTPATPTPQY